MTLSTAAHQASLSITISQNLLKVVFIDLVIPSNHLILCYLLLLLPSIFPSIRVFSNGLVVCNRWPKYWSFRRLIFFRFDWFDLLAVQGTLKSLLQRHNSKASILWHSAFFIKVHVSSIHDDWKNHSFDYVDLFGKVMSLLFNMLARFVIAFLPRSTPLLISWLQSCIYPFRIY